MTKKMLVWSGTFHSEAEIPETITMGQLSKARGWFRIRLGNALIIGTLISCIFIARSAKRDMQSGENVTKDNLEWHHSMGSKGGHAEREPPNRGFPII